MLKRRCIQLLFPLIVSIGFGAIVGYFLAPILGAMIGSLVFIMGVMALKTDSFARGFNQGHHTNNEFDDVVTSPTYAHFRGNIYNHDR